MNSIKILKLSELLVFHSKYKYFHAEEFISLSTNYDRESFICMEINNKPTTLRQKIINTTKNVKVNKEVYTYGCLFEFQILHNTKCAS